MATAPEATLLALTCAHDTNPALARERLPKAGKIGRDERRFVCYALPMVEGQQRMTADEFLAWAMQRPEGERFELAAGEVVAMAPERAAHGRVKGNIYRALRDAIDAGALPCEAYVDRMAVEVDEHTVYEPDVLLRCGERLPDDALKVLDPLLVVEVVSPTSRARDAGAKFEDYFRLPSVRHYLIVKVENRTIIHHVREPSGAITTRIISNNSLRLDPPGIELRGIFR